MVLNMESQFNLGICWDSHASSKLFFHSTENINTLVIYWQDSLGPVWFAD